MTAVIPTSLTGASAEVSREDRQRQREASVSSLVPFSCHWESPNSLKRLFRSSPGVWEDKRPELKCTHLNISKLFVEPLRQVRTVLHRGDLEFPVIEEQRIQNSTIKLEGKTHTFPL